MDPVIDKIKRTLNLWMQRDLTIKGRITVAKSLVVSQMTYFMAATEIDNARIEHIQALMKFIWRGRPPKVARSVMRQNVSEGGLNVPDLSMIYKAQRVAWLIPMLKHSGLTFVKVFLQRLHIEAMKDVLCCNYNKKWIKGLSLSSFYRDMLIWYRELIAWKEPRSGKEVRLQMVWHNQAIQVGEKSVHHRALAKKRIRYIDDFMDDSGRLLSYQ